MTELPDDMEKRLASMANWFSQLTDAPAPVSSSQAAKDLRALLLAYQERGRALEAASPVVPAPEGEAWRTVPVEPTEAMLVNGREALMPLVRLDSYGPLIGVWGDMLAASPVVPVGASRETVHDLILMRVFGPCDAISDELDSAVWNAADAIIAALRPTDAGWRDIAGAPLGVRVLADVVFNPPHTYFGARRVEIGSFDGHGWCGEGVGGEPVAWMPAPLPPAPTDTGANHD